MTSPPIDAPEVLRDILAHTQALLVDFDGPICSVFAGYPAHIVADQLRDALAQGGHSDFPTGIRATLDPFVVLAYALTLGTDEGRYVEAAFRAFEADAVRTAKPTPQGHEYLRIWSDSDRPLAVVSNNSIQSVTAYLDLHSLRSRVNVIAARTAENMDRLKPDPFLVNHATGALGIDSTRCTLLGDSVTDILASKAAGTRSIGYANKPGKVSSLSNCRPDVIITNMSMLTAESSL